MPGGCTAGDRRFHHVAFKVDDTAYDELIGRLKAAGEPVRETDHGYCRSMYCTSPDGLIVEFTVDPPDAAEIDAMRRADAHAELARWMAGDHRTNNDLRTHAEPEPPGGAGRACCLSSRDRWGKAPRSVASTPVGCRRARVLAADDAGVVKLVDTPDLGSGGESRGGSSPFARTIRRLARWM